MEHDKSAVAGVTLALVGFASSFAVVLAGLRAVGASPPQAASGLLALCVTQGLGTLLLSRRYRVPLTLAWSTPGAAMLASTGAVPGGWPSAVGAFVVAGALVVITGLWPLLGRLVASIPPAVAQAMLAGVLFPLCLAPVRHATDDPRVVLPLVIVWLAMVWWRPLWASPAVLALAVVLIAVDTPWATLHGTDLLPRLALTTPRLDITAVLSLALPLYLVTMASQNVAGAAVVSSYGHRVPWRACLSVTGIGSIVGAFAGGHAINLAAITAALAASPEAHRDPAQRWRASTTAGWTYLVLGLGSATLTVLATQARPGLLESVAGLALLGTLGSALQAATADEAARIPAVATFLLAASGITVLGVGAAFWALLVGTATLLLLRLPRPARATQAPVPAAETSAR